MAHVLGIDIGGTSIKAGLFAEGGRLLDVRQIPTGSLVCAEAFAGVVTGLRELCSVNDVDEGDVRAVGLDVPGPVDDQGRVGMLPSGGHARSPGLSYISELPPAACETERLV